MGNAWNNDVMTCIPTMGNHCFYGVCRKFSNYTPGTISNSGGSNDCKMIIEAAIFNESKCEGNPETSKEFRNSVGKCTAWDSSSTESNDLYSTESPGSCATRAVLIVRVVSLSGAKMHRSESQCMFLKFNIKSGYTLDTSSSMLQTKVPINSGS